MPALGVNIDHVATVRQARLTFEPDPVWAAVLAELGGADGITLHLREDRRHIQDHDLYTMKKTVQVKLNLEMAAEEEMTAIALEVRPDQVSLVPEKREELTTEGGLDVVANLERVEQCVHQLQQAGIEVSLFIDPDVEQIAAAKQVGVHAVELHTGRYADATSADEQQKEYDVIVKASEFTVAQGLKLHMGHGLTYRNVSKIAAIPDVCELNIGHSIVSRAVLVGMEQAVREMKALVTV
ncbi:pyridoxine 5'-phosphate synthase [Gimesia chilikensis]|jgi:pyridoxine 5-phosphate synthase|uniref:Pyridoxine 5'-phosphate synthase n=1 Tax=Gimesia chilikensis TaxID=2605989 RepID=A0A517PSI6_9PLAN|nr:pyridoxine 5'-phosphate synthase [Gimesia chilikensis]MBN73674.1 pyridoxine 5'-phosphate synthase [Gimesia sp.]MCR9233872.1 pyridoxine 5'-phosphate synthase [bacterium]QDT22331.1 Pyridoxine 5'-phosphate synthase [Gimesia chilikensis]QDT86261.1 Pyridoxine 5'-phosphate synthase [Gimesia chilikensis]QDU04346.1 Pyridoxine 5'-phosphate synthase [Gimesia chilikensis]